MRNGTKCNLVLKVFIIGILAIFLSSCNKESVISTPSPTMEVLKQENTTVALPTATEPFSEPTLSPSATPSITESARSDQEILSTTTPSKLTIKETVRLGGGIAIDVAYHPDGSMLAVSGSQGVRLFDTTTRKSLELLNSYGKSYCVAWSPDGQKLAFGNEFGSIWIWDQSQESDIKYLHGHSGYVDTLAWSPDGSLLASGGKDGKVKIWDVMSGENIITRTVIKGGWPGWVDSVAWSPDGEYLAAGGRTYVVSIWKTDSWHLVQELDVNFKEQHFGIADTWTESIAWAPYGSTLAAITTDGVIRVWDVPGGDLLHFLPQAGYRETDLVWSSDGSKLVATGRQVVRFWDTDTWKQGKILYVDDHLLSIAISPDSKYLATVNYGNDTPVQLWDIQGNKMIGVMEGFTSNVLRFDWSLDGIYLVANYWQRDESTSFARVWDVNGGAEVDTYQGWFGGVNDVAWSPDGEIIATANWDGNVYLWDVWTGEILQTIIGHMDVVRQITWSPDGERLATRADDGTVRVWDPNEAEQIYLLEAGGFVNWSPDGQYLAARREDTQIWDASSGVLIGLSGCGDLYQAKMSWSPDGDQIACWGFTSSEQDSWVGFFVGEYQPVVRVLDSVTHELQYEVASIMDPVVEEWEYSSWDGLFQFSYQSFDLAWSPDGERIAVGGFDYRVLVLNAVNGEVLSRLTGHQGQISQVKWSPDGTRLASSSHDGTIRVWTITSSSGD